VSKSLWKATASPIQFSPLTEDRYADVCIVGGGIAGLTTAYILLKEGKSVCLLESLEIGGGQTGQTTAHFTAALDDRYFEIERMHGVEGAQLAADSHTQAINKAVDIVRRENIECDLKFVDGYLFAQGDPHKDVLMDELKAVRRAGLNEITYLGSSPVSFFSGPCLKFPDQMQLHPLKYIHGLCRAIQSMGGKIFTNSHVTKVVGGADAHVSTASAIVNCKAIVMATNTPINDLFAIHTKQAPYRTYVLAFRIPKGSVPAALYWDTIDPYHYIRVAGENEDILVVGGEDRKTGQDDYPEDRYDVLELWVRERFKSAEEVLYRWSGQVMEPVDCMGFLGRNPMDKDNVYIITGDSGNGMTHTTIGAMLITDLIQGRDNPWAKLYEPSRITLRATGSFLQENLNVAAQYTDYFTVKKEPDFTQMPTDSGVVFRKGLRMIAAYKNKDNQVEFMAANCPHLGGVLNWNNAEKSWDCPAHGSRFDCHGRVIEGPACEHLKKLKQFRAG
jgi:glycine/D-amino acid oxidase-like deaminating enzyme/nitrite reductase/ring-hydroxylating ferredoxin subunit